MAGGGILGRVFGSKRAIDNLTDKDNGLLVRAGSWVGGLHYTDEERAEAAVETREWGLRQLAALEPFKVVQRILAFYVCTVWAFVALNVVAAIWVDSWRDCTPADTTCVPVTPFMIDFALSNYIFWPTIAVLSLYFTGGVLPGVFNSGKK